MFTKQLSVVQAALDRLGNLLGGHIYDGSALNTDGIAERGRFVMIGPLVVFKGNDGKAGLAEQLRGSTDATLIDIGPEHQAGIAAVVSSGTGLLPLDSTMGNALKIKQVQETWWEHINKGGVVIWPLLALGLGVGVGAALLAVWPSLNAPGSAMPWASLGWMLGGVLASGMLWTWLAATAALRGELLPALRHE